MTIPTAALVGLSAGAPATDLENYGHELDAIQAFGVDSIELPTFDMDIVVGGQIRRDRLKQLVAICAGRGLVYSAHGPLSINLMDEPWRIPRHMQVLEASLQVAAEVGAVNYVLHGGLIPQQQADGVADALDRQRAALAEAATIAGRLGVNLCVETMFSGYLGQRLTASPAQLAADLAVIDHPNLWATLDFSHSWLKFGYEGRKAAFLDEVSQLSPRARHLHLHDSFGRQDDIPMHSDGERVAFGHGDLHLPMGWGDIPWDDIFASCSFPEGVILNLEMKHRYWHSVAHSVARARDLAAQTRIIRCS